MEKRVTNKAEFLEALGKLLNSLPPDEQREAMEYYQNYFEDAGTEQEQRVLATLGSPESVAKAILGSQDQESGWAEDQSEKFHADLPNNAAEQPEEHVSPASQTSVEPFGVVEEGEFRELSPQEKEYGEEEKKSQQQSLPEENPEQTKQQQTQRPTASSTVSDWVVPVVIICTFPIWFSLAIVLFSVALAIVCVFFFFVLVLFLLSLAFAAGAVFSFVAGGMAMGSSFGTGLFGLGAGLFLLGLTVLSFWLWVRFTFSLVPTMVRGVVDLCKLPFQKWKGGAAA